MSTHYEWFFEKFWWNKPYMVVLSGNDTMMYTHGAEICGQATHKVCFGATAVHGLTH